MLLLSLLIISTKYASELKCLMYGSVDKTMPCKKCQVTDNESRADSSYFANRASTFHHHVLEEVMKHTTWPVPEKDMKNMSWSTLEKVMKNISWSEKV